MDPVQISRVLEFHHELCSEGGEAQARKDHQNLETFYIVDEEGELTDEDHTEIAKVQREKSNQQDVDQELGESQERIGEILLYSKKDTEDVLSSEYEHH